MCARPSKHGGKMADFATAADVEALLQITLDTVAKATAVERALGAATAAIRNYTKQHLSRVAGDTVTLDSAGGHRLLLPELPVISVAAVVEDGAALTAGTDYKLGQHGILYRLNRPWACGIQIVQVTYTHGYDPLPDDIVDVATRAAARVYQAGLRAAEDDGVPGVSSKSLGDFSVSFASDAGGGVGEGMMGASAARPLLLSEKDLLNRYRSVVQ